MHLGGVVGTSVSRPAFLSARTRGLWHATYPGAAGGGALGGCTALPRAAAAELEAYEPGTARHRARRAPSRAAWHSPATSALRPTPGTGRQSYTSLVALA